jgi:hypothetical protein
MAYETELGYKRQIVTTIAHCRNRTELLLHLAMWTYDPSVPPDVRNLIDAMLYETGHLG